MLQHIWRGQRSWLIAGFLAVASSLGCGSSADDNDNDSKGNAGKGGSDTPNGGGGGSTDDVIKGSDELLGTGDSCTSYTAAKDDKCAGWFCGVTEMQLMDAVDPKAKCGSNVPLLCKGSVPEKVAVCARRLKAAMFDASNEVLKPMVRDCVYEDESIKEAVPEACLNCSIDAAACAGDNCLIQCAGGDNEPCDTCRRANGCDQAVFRCGGLPPTIE